jgi:hypothetical protein
MRAGTRGGLLLVQIGTAALGLVTASCSTSSGCNAENCRAAFTCLLEPPGATDYTCFESSSFVPYLSSDAGQAAILDYCARACNAVNDAVEFQCIGQNFPGDTCSTLQMDIIFDGGPVNGVAYAVAAKCGFPLALPDAGSGCGPQCTACGNNCRATKFQCNAGCLDAGSGDVCLSCNFNCNQQLEACFNACPMD